MSTSTLTPALSTETTSVTPTTTITATTVETITPLVERTIEATNPVNTNDPENSPTLSTRNIEPIDTTVDATKTKDPNVELVSPGMFAFEGNISPEIKENKKEETVYTTPGVPEAQVSKENENKDGFLTTPSVLDTIALPLPTPSLNSDDTSDINQPSRFSPRNSIISSSTPSTTATPPSTPVQYHKEGKEPPLDADSVAALSEFTKLDSPMWTPPSSATTSTTTLDSPTETKRDSAPGSRRTSEEKRREEDKPIKEFTNDDLQKHYNEREGNQNQPSELTTPNTKSTTPSSSVQPPSGWLSFFWSKPASTTSPATTTTTTTTTTTATTATTDTTDTTDTTPSVGWDSYYSLWQKTRNSPPDSESDPAGNAQNEFLVMPSSTSSTSSTSSSTTSTTSLKPGTTDDGSELQEPVGLPKPSIGSRILDFCFVPPEKGVNWGKCSDCFRHFFPWNKKEKNQ